MQEALQKISDAAEANVHNEGLDAEPGPAHLKEDTTLDEELAAASQQPLVETQRDRLIRLVCVLSYMSIFVGPPICSCVMHGYVEGIKIFVAFVRAC